MQIPKGLQPRVLLAHPAALAKHLQTILRDSQENLTSINSCLLHQAHTEAITCRAYQTWLFIAYRHSPDLLSGALRDQQSAGVRRAGIKVLHHIFHRPSWKVQGWDRLGGVHGIKTILDELPLADVALFVKAISRGGRGSNRELRATCMDELMCLIDSSDSWTSRSLSSHVARLYAHCSPKKVTEVLRSGIPKSQTFYQDLGQLHPRLLRQIAISAVEVDRKVRRHILNNFAKVLLGSNEAYAPIHATEIHSNIPPGLRFGEDLLSQIRMKEPKLLDDKDLIRQWTEDVLSLAIRSNVPFGTILHLISTCLEMCRAADTKYWILPSLPKLVIRCWSTAKFGVYGNKEPFHSFCRKVQLSSPSQPKATDQTALEDCLIQHVLQTRDERVSAQPRQANLSLLLKGMLLDVHIDGRLEFLQLFCKNSPTLNFDLEAWPPSEEERKLIPIWEHCVLQVLPVSSSMALFRRSLHIHQHDTFLPDDLLKQKSWALTWEQQCSLWARWELSIPEASKDFPVTRKALAEMQQRAMRDKESSGRLLWTRSAIQLASETKSLDIYCEMVQWSQRFLRDQKVFPGVLTTIFGTADQLLSCRADTRAARLGSISDLRVDVQKADLILKSLLESLLLLLREPWASKRSCTMATLPSMFSSIVRQRMHAVNKYLSDGLATKSELVEILLDSLLPSIIEYERAGNAEGQEVFDWSGPNGVTGHIPCPDNPSRVQLSFMDRFSKARDDLWKDLRQSGSPFHPRGATEPEVGWPSGLPIQSLPIDKRWLHHALKRSEEAPFLFSRTYDLLFSPRDIITTAISEVPEHNRKYVDNLGFAMKAVISRGAGKTKWITLIWKHYSSALQAHPLYLELFQKWLVDLLREAHADEAIAIVEPAVSPTPTPLISKVPMGLETTEWDPQQDFDDTVEVDELSVDEKRPREIPCILLNKRMQQRYPTSEDFVRTREIKPRPRPNPIAIWSTGLSPFGVTENGTYIDNREAVILSALLYLDTFTSKPCLSQRRFPDTESPRYGPTRLAEAFLTRVANLKAKELMRLAIDTLSRNYSQVPAQVLRDLVCSLLDTLKASQNAPTYPMLLNCTFELIKVLLRCDQPQLVAEVALRVWKEFPNDSSRHRNVSLVKIGRVITPDQAGNLMESFVAYACETLQKQHTPSDSPGKPFIKVTTLKMLVQGLDEADFLASSTRLSLLEKLWDASSHIDVRVIIAKSAFRMVKKYQGADLPKFLSIIALSAAGPSESHTITEDDWRAAEAGGPLPSIEGKERPILELVVEDAQQYIPNELQLVYAREILLPLVTESIRQHTRWMEILVARLGVSFSDHGLTAQDIGPFSPDLVNLILSRWPEFLPDTYLQYHRSWGLVYLHRDSFNRITDALAMSTDPIKSEASVRKHLQNLLISHRERCPFQFAYRFTFLNKTQGPNAITSELLIDEFQYRLRVFSKSPFAYNSLLRRYIAHPGYTLMIMQVLRSARDEQSAFSDSFYAHATKLMVSIVHAAELARKEGWSPDLKGAPVTLPSAFEYEVALLPGRPDSTSTPSNSLLDEFVSEITALVSKYAADPALLINIESFLPILKGVKEEHREACALMLAANCDNITDRDRPVQAWARVKLAIMLLQLRSEQRSVVPLKDTTLDMIEAWKACDIEMVRRIAWAWEWKGCYPVNPYQSIWAFPYC